MALHNEASGKGVVMPTITRSALQWLQDELESLVEQRDQLEDELSEALEENASLKAQLNGVMSDRSAEV